jgi:hypothetical protein
MHLFLISKLKKSFPQNVFSLVDIRRKLHHYTRLPDTICRSILEDLIEMKLIVIKKVEKKPVYTVDTDVEEIQILKIEKKNLKQLEKNYKKDIELLKRRYGLEDESNS